MKTPEPPGLTGDPGLPHPGSAQHREAPRRLTAVRAALSGGGCGLARLAVGLALAGAGLRGTSQASQVTVSQPVEFFGACDASAAVAVDAHRFLLGNDEDSRLRLYRADAPGLPERVFDLAPFLQLDPGHPETDLEAAARVGDRVYWISSHGRNASGKRRRDRERFFATRIQVRGEEVTVDLDGAPYKDLLADLSADPRLTPYRLDQAARNQPKAPGGLNIEGLCATPEGHLLIGFRNPIPHAKALIVPLLNPEGTISGARARLGDPIELDLGGLGVRDLIYAGGAYYAIAGASDTSKGSRLYRWKGPGHPARRVQHATFRHLHPEALIQYPSAGPLRLQVLSDDGTREIDGCPCKELKDPARQRFRSVWVQWE